MVLLFRGRPKSTNERCTRQRYFVCKWLRRWILPSNLPNHRKWLQLESEDIPLQLRSIFAIVRHFFGQHARDEPEYYRKSIRKVFVLDRSHLLDGRFLRIHSRHLVLPSVIYKSGNHRCIFDRVFQLLHHFLQDQIWFVRIFSLRTKKQNI